MRIKTDEAPSPPEAAPPERSQSIAVGASDVAPPSYWQSLPPPKRTATQATQASGMPRRKPSLSQSATKWLKRSASDPGPNAVEEEETVTGGPTIPTRINPHGNLDVLVDLNNLPHLPNEIETGPTAAEIHLDPAFKDCPPLNIVIFIVGSRGDVQPYVALALQLIISRGHRVRIATHATFASLVTEASVRLAGMTDSNGEPLTSRLEHYDIGGDPQQLMAYMVKNPGLLPGIDSMFNGDISNKRRMVKEMLHGCYRSCFCPNATTSRPFAADAIIANPPSFAHIHVAESLGIPIVMSFTMPWTPTASFPHPLVTVKDRTDTDQRLNHFASFILADALMWQGLGDIVNSFRFNTLDLRPLDLSKGPLVLSRLRIPVTYAWSEALLPKPKDWGRNIDVVGFYSLPGKGNPKIDDELTAFLDAGKPPIYIGFGSVVVEKPDELTAIILEAVKRTGVRALVSAGWADLGASSIDIPDSVFIIKGNVSHEWLFAEGRVCAVCHHGGAGTTAAGLHFGVPTIIVPFFGDQWFWGRAVAKAGAGPQPIPHKELTADNLSAAIKFALSPPAQRAARQLGQVIAAEDGVSQGVDSFHKHLPLLNMRCEIDRDLNALWWCERYCLRVSGAVAAVLVEEKLMDWPDFTPHRPTNYDATRHYTDPFGAVGQSVLNLTGQVFTGTGQLFYAPHKGLANLVLGVPKASLDVVSSLHEGLENMPGIMGVPKRKRDRVNNFTSGMSAGVMGFGWGLYDGLSGLVTEPYKGARRDGLIGFVGGAAAGIGSLPARVAGGALGLVVHPATGMYRGARTRLSRMGITDNTIGGALFEPRMHASYAAMGTLSRPVRQKLIQDWNIAISPSTTEQRRKTKERQNALTEAMLLHEDSEFWHPQSSLWRMRRERETERMAKKLGATNSNNAQSTSGSRAESSRQDWNDGSTASTPTTNVFSAGFKSPVMSDTSASSKDGRYAEMHSQLSSPGTTFVPGPPGSTADSKDARYADLVSTLAHGQLEPGPPGFSSAGDKDKRPPSYGAYSPSLSSSPAAPPQFKRHDSSRASFASTADVALAGTERWATRSEVSVDEGHSRSVSGSTDDAHDVVRQGSLGTVVEDGIEMGRGRGKGKERD